MKRLKFKNLYVQKSVNTDCKGHNYKEKFDFSHQ